MRTDLVEKAAAPVAVEPAEGEGPVDVVTRTVAAWSGVTISEGRFASTAFHLGRRELGHLHARPGGDGVADLPFPRSVRDELIAAGRARPHHALPDSGWVSAPLRDSAGIQNAIALFAAADGRARAAADRREGVRSAELTQRASPTSGCRPGRPSRRPRAKAESQQRRSSARGCPGNGRAPCTSRGATTMVAAAAAVRRRHRVPRHGLVRLTSGRSWGAYPPAGAAGRMETDGPVRLRDPRWRHGGVHPREPPGAPPGGIGCCWSRPAARRAARTSGCPPGSATCSAARGTTGATSPSRTPAE